MIYVPRSPDENAELIEWAANRIENASFEKAQAVGVYRHGVLAAVAVFHDYRAPSIHISLAADSPRWATKEVMRFLAGYAFVTCGCKVIVATASKWNKPSRRLLEGLGFDYSGKIPDGAPDGDVCIYNLHYSKMKDWRYGEKHPSSAAAA